MTNNFHDLITRMANELDEYRRLLLDDCTVTHRLSNEARAALTDGPAVPEGREPAAVTRQPSDGEGPSAEDVEELCEEHCFNVEGYESIECLQGLINEAIARWGRPAPAPPADGEVAELVAWLREQLHVRLQAPWTPGIKHFGRVADLLEQQALVPVSISERLPGPEDCDAEGRCWFGTPRMQCVGGQLGTPKAITPAQRDHLLAARPCPAAAGGGRMTLHEFALLTVAYCVVCGLSLLLASRILP